MRVLASSIILAICLGAMPEAQATEVPIITSSVVDCGGGSSTSFGPPISCSIGDSSAEASATFTTLKTKAHNAPLAFATLRDSARFLPGDAALSGAAGTARFTMDFDGSVGIGPENFLSLRGYEVDAITGLKNISFEASFVALTTTGISVPFEGVTGSPGIISLFASPVAATYTGSITFIFDYTFGSDLNYLFQMAAVAPTGTVDFYNTATISNVQAFDAFGNVVDGTFTTASGTILPTATGGVPEPATWAMMLVGFSAIGFSIRRKQRQSVRYSFG